MYSAIYYTKEQKQKTPKKRMSFRIFVTALLVFISFYIFLGGLFIKSEREPGSIINPVVVEVAKKGISFINSRENSKKLENIVQSILKKDKDAQFSVVIRNLDTGERYYLNEDQSYKTASLYKLWVMGEVYEQIENKTLNQKEVLEDSVENLNKRFDIASESAELTEGKVSWPVLNALTNMITVSDNYSALLLTEKIGLDNIAKYLSDNGLDKSKIGSSYSYPQSTASDIALFLEKLYMGELANDTSTEEMLSLLKQQKINTKLTQYLPKGTVVAHKTGELEDVTHDAGIVYAKKGNYVIVVMSKSNNVLNTEDEIGQISLKVFDYFNY